MKMNIKDRILEEFLRVKEVVGHRPSRVEFFNNINDEIYSAIKRNKSELNFFNDYLTFLKENGELFESEETLFNSIGHDFIKMIETTKMSKSYKIPVFLAFYNGGKVKMKIDEEDVYRSFYEFYRKGSNRVDMLRDKGTAGFESWDIAKYVRLAGKNPVRALVRSEGKYFRNSNKVLMELTWDIKDIIEDVEFIRNMNDAINYRNDKYCEERRFEKNN